MKSIITMFILLMSLTLWAEKKHAFKINNVKTLKHNHIEIIARKIFFEETNIMDFIGVNCLLNVKKEYKIWVCNILQSATNFNGEKYTMVPPDMGTWILEINFIENSYVLKKMFLNEKYKSEVK